MLKNKIFVSGLFIFLFVFIFAFKAYGNQGMICLKKSYDLYRQNFMSDDGRIIDYDRDCITTSEGQSYMMLRALVVDDKQTFDLCYKWTKDNLQREDNLFSWLWGKNSDGAYKTLDCNSASDADIDIAYALFRAYEKWGDYAYLKDARLIINSIWLYEVKPVGKNLVLVSGVKQANEEPMQVNPSYFAPYEFRLFQKYDELHDWNLLVDSSYIYWNANMAKTKTGLPSNWFLIKDGQMVLEDNERSDFSYDAIRVFARAYMDYAGAREKRALSILKKSKFFVSKWHEDKVFYTNYQANGQLRDKDKFLGSIAILDSVISVYDRKMSEKIYKKELKSSFEGEEYWSCKNNYYGKNLSWFAHYVYFKKFHDCVAQK